MNELAKNKLSFEKLKVIDAKDFNQFLNGIIHDWLKTLTFLVITLVPLFFVLDYFIVPKDLLKQVAIYRLLATFIVIIQFLIIRKTKPRQPDQGRPPIKPFITHQKLNLIYLDFAIIYF